ncbi:S1 RNA-binding domain-containing protein [Oscillatoria sp. FACHB-1406]|uniref:S1 RNA-binding domain-containing protein n=1 Tax=Oscillatoria sp. FACHB-1406 TaxID=2692846 RepID=UPI001686B3F4|nr:S1 RNA-binding domain-containing protein [Oscillatoria sp. FACHB-1406]MBD2578802.1 30S ribosomal protein S1 [Oscillatoria sp. FACHB-1406]
MTSDSTRSQSSTAPFSMEDFEKALEDYSYEFSKGKVVRGKVFEYSSDGVYVDMGGKSPGFIPQKEISWERLSDAKLAEILPLGVEQEFVVLREQDENGQVLLSYRQVRIKQAWEEVKALHAEGKSVRVRVTGVNKGGVTGEVKELRAFIPRSHLLQKDDMDALIGQSLTASFLEVNPETNKLVLSQRDAIRASAMERLAPGTVVEGRVSSIKPYGVFVDLGSVSGLLHIREVSGSRVGALEQVFRIGQNIKVAIAEIDEYKNRISLSTKGFERYPGELLEKMDEVMAEAEERFMQKQQPGESE